MTRPAIVVGFTDYFPVMDEFFIDVLSHHFQVIRNDVYPDYLFFADETFGRKNLTYNNTVKKIFFTGENRRPWNYKADHYISFDHMHDSRHYRLPLYVIDNWVHMKKLNLPDIRLGKISGVKNHFCSFVVANPCCSERNNIFHKISQYKQVNSAGPLFNNVGFMLPRDGINAQKSKFQFLTQHKFNICYENGSYPGYVTEKLLQSLYCSSIPIYWGSPTVEVDFNPKAIINRLDFDSDDDMLQRIIEHDTDDDKYNEMVNQPIVSKRNSYLNVENFVSWFANNVYKG